MKIVCVLALFLFLTAGSLLGTAVNAAAQSVPEIPAGTSPHSVAPVQEPGPLTWGAVSGPGLFAAVARTPFAPFAPLWLPALQARWLPRSLPVAVREPEAVTRRSCAGLLRGAER